MDPLDYAAIAVLIIVFVVVPYQKRQKTWGLPQIGRFRIRARYKGKEIVLEGDLKDATSLYKTGDLNVLKERGLKVPEIIKAVETPWIRWKCLNCKKWEDGRASRKCACEKPRLERHVKSRRIYMLYGEFPTPSQFVGPNLILAKQPFDQVEYRIPSETRGGIFDLQVERVWSVDCAATPARAVKPFVAVWVMDPLNQETRDTDSSPEDLGLLKELATDIAALGSYIVPRAQVEKDTERRLKIKDQSLERDKEVIGEYAIKADEGGIAGSAGVLNDEKALPERGKMNLGLSEGTKNLLVAIAVFFGTYYFATQGALGLDRLPFSGVAAAVAYAAYYFLFRRSR